jgi:ribonuclease HI
MLSHRGMLQLNLCPRCNQEPETTLHCLRDCAFVNRFWRSIGFSGNSFFQTADLYEWLRTGVKGSSIYMFLAAVWWLWRARNKLCMKNELVSLVSLKVCTENYAHLLINCFWQHHSISPMRVIRWNDQGGTGMILNVDGSSLGNPGVSGFGGLIRNSDGTWIQGFAGNIGFSNILHAELLGVYYGLVMAWEVGCSELWCYSDSKLAIKLISEPVNTWHHYAAILHNIQELLARDWQVHLLHTLREGNACADYLAKMGARNLEAYNRIIAPPVGISLLLLADASGVSFTR